MILISKWIYILIKWYFYMAVVSTLVLLLLKLDMLVHSGLKSFDQYSSSISYNVGLFSINLIWLIIVLFIPKAMKVVTRAIQNKEQIAQWIKDN